MLQSTIQQLLFCSSPLDSTENVYAIKDAATLSILSYPNFCRFDKNEIEFPLLQIVHTQWI